MNESRLDLEPNDDLESEDSSVMLSIGDLMSGLLMIFALLFMIVYIQYQEELRRARELEERVKKYEQVLQSLPEIIRSKLEKELGKNGNFRVDPQTGDLQIGDRILFDENSSILSPRGKAFLNQFIPAYSNVVFSLPEELGGQISRLSLEGSTSSSGNDQENMNLSVRRAASVYNYIFNDPAFPNFSTKSQLRQKMVVAGRGEIDADQRTIRASDRRVTFKFQMRRPTFIPEPPQPKQG